MAARKDLFGCPGESRLGCLENQIEDVRFLFSPLTTPPLWPRIQRCLRREVDEIWEYRMGGNLTTFDKDHGTAEEGRSRRFLRPSRTASLQLLFYVRLVAIKRGWVRVPNLKFRSRSWSCSTVGPCTLRGELRLIIILFNDVPFSLN